MVVVDRVHGWVYLWVDLLIRYLALCHDLSRKSHLTSPFDIPLRIYFTSKPTCQVTFFVSRVSLDSS